MIIGPKKRRSLLPTADRRVANFEVKRKRNKTIGSLSEYNEVEDAESDEESMGEAMECPEPHDLKEMIDVKLPVSASKVNQMIYGSQSSWYKNFSTSQNFTNLNMGEFEEKEGEVKRFSSYVTPVKGNLGPKTANVKETLTKCKSSKEGSLYAYSGEVTNSGVPYQDAFYLVSHICISNQGPSKCRFYVGLEVRYRKSVWGMVKSMIEKGSYSQAAELYVDMSKALSTGKSEKGAKPKRSGSEIDTKSTASSSLTPSASSTNYSQLITWILIGLLIMFNFMLYIKVGSIGTTAVTRSQDQPTSEIGHVKQPEEAESFLKAEDENDWRRMMRIVVRELKKNEILVEALRHQMITYESQRLLEEEDELVVQDVPD